MLQRQLFKHTMGTMNTRLCHVATRGPTTFQHEMNKILCPILRKFVVVFIDDILIYSKTWDDHLVHII